MPYTYQQSREEVARLVEQFQRHEATLQDAAEAQIENDYLRPLFRYLNWNVDNRGLSPAQQEFVLQKTDRKGKRPDYRLQLNGQHLLFMDAKKVKYAMHDPRWINQVYAYAYSTQNNPTPRKVDFAVLTDFQEFITLDCTLYAARPEAVQSFRVFDWRFPDYVAKFDTLWEVFERNNMLEASRERTRGLWAHYLSPKIAKANRTPPDKAFLAQLDDEKTGWRVRLAKEMKRLDPTLDGEIITAAVQLLIDRLIFVKVLSDREIEDDYLAQLAERVERAGLSEQAGTWFAACRDIFEKLNQFYNGSIFEPRPELEAVQVSNKVVREVIRDLQPEYSPYNFAVLPVEILGTIYERFLGRVVTATAQRVKIEDKSCATRAAPASRAMLLARGTGQARSAQGGRRLLHAAVHREQHRAAHRRQAAGRLPHACRCCEAENPRPRLRFGQLPARRIRYADRMAQALLRRQGTIPCGWWQGTTEPQWFACIAFQRCGAWRSPARKPQRP